MTSAGAAFGSGNALDELTDVVVCLPAGTAQQATLCYTTADGEEVPNRGIRRKTATLVQLEGTVLAESIRLGNFFAFPFGEGGASAG